jgi:hypothetical protein
LSGCEGMVSLDRTYFDIAIAILKEEPRPMTAREIPELALTKSLIAAPGKTPEASMNAALYTHTKGAASVPIVREFEPGPTRARRGSVRWVYMPASSAGST